MTTQSMTPALPAAKAATTGDYLRQFAVIVVTLLTITVNGMANALPINGIQTGKISDQYPVLFTPAGYVFAIWGVIYLGILAYMVFQALPSQRTNPRLRAIGWLYVVSGLANSGWIFLWHYFQLGWSVLVMLVLLTCLILIYARLWPTRRQVSRGEWWTTNLTFSIYLGWITVATVANITVFLYQAGWNGFGISPELWTVIMLLVATGLGAFFGLRLFDAAYVLVLVWAFVGIWVKQGAMQGSMVAWAALGLSITLAVVAIVALMQNRDMRLAAASTDKRK
jgi:benzodiazapine receptor